MAVMNAHITLHLFAFCGILALNLVSASTKKGLCIAPKVFYCDDFKIWSNVNWWYDWTMNFWLLQHNSNCTTFAPHFVPMIWSWRLHADHPVNIPQGAEYVLGFNEPNIKSQGNLTAQEAARHWRTIEHRSRGLPLVGPAAAICANRNPVKCHGNSTEWYDEFFKHCTGCRVDYLAAHTYICNADKTMKYLEMLYQRYGKKLWLTEFACPYTHSIDTQLNYMKQMLPRLEAADFVYRYSWFNSRFLGDGFVNPSASLLEQKESKLTRLGQYYNNFQGSGTQVVG